MLSTISFKIHLSYAYRYENISAYMNLLTINKFILSMLLIIVSTNL
nr:MAG TPA: hypothetical protein [Caudoviricetes sp.]DAL79718.1 MAG TPA: hypothetical protein [Caudoviricetes sp.]DAL91577.1 MAG TPA: hypothetical protein [Caudoviricetes sp.]DAY88589.1 MAG TPA: hypothetical protein [Caudoviricetes sp.]